VGKGERDLVVITNIRLNVVGLLNSLHVLGKEVLYNIKSSVFWAELVDAQLEEITASQ
jgi:hypothetical protein